MRHRTRSILKLGRWAIAPLALAGCQSVGAAEYVLKDLGTLGGTWSGAFGVNDAGQVPGARPCKRWRSSTRGRAVWQLRR